MMLRINLLMTMLALVIIPLVILITKVFVKRSQDLFDLQQKTVGQLNGTITELYGGLVTYLTIGTCAVVGCLQVIQGVITIGQLQAFIRYVWQINDPLSQVSQLSAQVQAAFSALRRIFTLLSEEEEVQEGTVKIDKASVGGNVSFEHVRFGYDKDLLMKDVNIEVESGQTVAIVGPTGAGKTTLMNLLLRFYDVKGGAIKIDGVDIRDMKREDLRSLFSLVLQDTWLFSGSIYDNIRYGRLNASDEECRAAAKLANADGFIRRLPDGYDTMLTGDGSNLSQGQRDARKDEIISAAKMANVHHYIRTLTKGYDSLINEEANNISQGEKQLQR